MDATDVMKRMAEVIDAKAWDDLPNLLDPAFTCRYVHTGEEFDGPAWVRANAEYPGFEHMVLEDCVGNGARAAGRARVTGVNAGKREQFGVASFITVHDGRIIELVEVWTDIGEPVPTERRPDPAPGGTA